MTDYEIIEQGPRHRTLRKPSGELIIQHMEVWTRRYSMGLDTPDFILERTATMAVEQVIEDALDYTDDPIIRAGFSGWDQVEINDDEGFRFKILCGYADAYYWPRLAPERVA